MSVFPTQGRVTPLKPRSEYPDRLACTGLLALDGETVEIRYRFDDAQPAVDFTVLADDVLWVSMAPPIPNPEDGSPQKPSAEAARVLFENYEFALLACKVTDRQAGYVIVEVPATTGARQVSVQPDHLLRRFQPHRPRAH